MVKSQDLVVFLGKGAFLVSSCLVVSLPSPTSEKCILVILFFIWRWFDGGCSHMAETLKIVTFPPSLFLLLVSPKTYQAWLSIFLHNYSLFCSNLEVCVLNLSFARIDYNLNIHNLNIHKFKFDLFRK